MYYNSQNGYHFVTLAVASCPFLWQKRVQWTTDAPDLIIPS